MSLSSVIFNGFLLDSDLYRCPEHYPPATRRPFWGIWFFCSGIIILLFYIPCLIAISSSDFMRTAAYKTMLLLGFYDILSTLTHSIFTGIFGFYGVQFCDYPRLIFCIGAIGLGSWMACCVTGMLLAVIRIGDFSDSSKLSWFFSGFRIYIFLSFSLIYGLYAAFFTVPIIFSPVHMTWFFDPMLNNHSDYTNWAHTLNNIVVVAVTTAVYSLLGYLVIQKGSVEHFSKYQISLLLQTFLFCIFHAVSSSLYAYMQFFSTSDALILVGQISWQISSGAVCLVYLTLNRTLRNSVVKMFCPMFKGSVQVLPMGSADSRANYIVN